MCGCSRGRGAAEKLMLHSATTTKTTSRAYCYHLDKAGCRWAHRGHARGRSNVTLSSKSWTDPCSFRAGHLVDKMKTLMWGSIMGFVWGRAFSSCCFCIRKFYVHGRLKIKRIGQSFFQVSSVIKWFWHHIFMLTLYSQNLWKKSNFTSYCKIKTYLLCADSKTKSQIFHLKLEWLSIYAMISSSHQS